MNSLMALHSRFVKAKTEFIAKHDELMSLSENPSRFISTYFGSIRLQINSRYEQLFQSLSFVKPTSQENGFCFEPEKIQRISQIRTWLIDELNRNENKCIQELAMRLSSVDGAVMTSEPSPTSESNGFCSPPSTATTMDTEVIDRDQPFLFDVDGEIESLKRLLLNNKSFFFIESDKNGFGTLFEFQNRYLTYHEKKIME